MARKAVESNIPDPEKTAYLVRRWEGCMVVEGLNPPISDLSALFRQWSEYHEPRMRWGSVKLAKLLGAYAVICSDIGHEASLLEKYGGADVSQAPEAAASETDPDSPLDGPSPD